MPTPRTFIPSILIALFIAPYLSELSAASFQPPKQNGTNIRSERIINGNFTDDLEFPGMVSIQLDGIHMYGGSILTNIWILTTARAYRPYTEGYMVVAGTNNLLEGGTYHKVVEVICRKDYNESTYADDIALLKLRDPISLGKLARPVRIRSVLETLAEGTPGLVIGWGWSTQGVSSQSNELRKETIFITNHDKCNKAYSELEISILPTHICAEDPKGQTGPCMGDSGGPFIINGEVVGVISFSLGCTLEGYPNVITDVSKYLDWIRMVIMAHL